MVLGSFFDNWTGRNRDHNLGFLSMLACESASCQSLWVRGLGEWTAQQMFSCQTFDCKPYQMPSLSSRSEANPFWILPHCFCLSLQLYPCLYPIGTCILCFPPLCTHSNILHLYTSSPVPLPSWKIIACTFSFLAKHGPELGISCLLGNCLTQLTILFIFIETWKMSVSFFCQLWEANWQRGNVYAGLQFWRSQSTTNWIAAHGFGLVAHHIGGGDGAKREGGAEVSKAVQRHPQCPKTLY